MPPRSRRSRVAWAQRCAGSRSARLSRKSCCPCGAGEAISAIRIGVLSLQGDFFEHAAALRRLGAEPVEVRLPTQLADLAGLIIPGGESTTIGKLMAAYDLLGPLRRLAGEGFPVYGS